MIAALFVAKGGVYFDLDDVDPWDISRDARLYSGPHPVVAHPPCERWGRYWSGGPNSVKFPRARQVKGADGGCFAAALSAVRRFGGVIEHPAYSHAWAAFALPRPAAEGWHRDISGGWCAQVAQGNYGHKANKATWLYVVGAPELPSLIYGKSGKSGKSGKFDDSYHSAEERAEAKASGKHKAVPRERLSRRERAATPIPFRDLLLDIARSVRP